MPHAQGAGRAARMAPRYEQPDHAWPCRTTAQHPAAHSRREGAEPVMPARPLPRWTREAGASKAAAPVRNGRAAGIARARSVPASVQHPRRAVAPGALSPSTRSARTPARSRERRSSRKRESRSRRAGCQKSRKPGSGKRPGGRPDAPAVEDVGVGRRRELLRPHRRRREAHVARAATQIGPNVQLGNGPPYTRSATTRGARHRGGRDGSPWRQS